MLVLFVISVAVLSDAGLSVEVFRAGVAPRCESRACNPRMGNLALGRRVLTQTVCGNNGTELYCSYSDPNTNLACSAAKCAKCNAGLPLLSHLAGGMSDSSFRHPNTWWQSAEGVESETVQLDLEAEFYFTHLIVVFRSPRPAAMTLERSQDFGRTWKMLQYYAGNCSAAFGLEEGKAGGGQDGASCTSKYSAAYPCNRGEVIYRTLPKWESLDPFGEEGQQQLRVTNVRIRLLKHQPCPCQAKDLASAHEALPTQHFAIYDLIVKGSCFCNGHAEQCVPAPGYQPIRDRTNHVVHGKCVCRHNTAGDHCERCAPLYNDRPWQPADGLTGAPQECRKCKCNGHAQSCHFDWTAWRESGQQSGGVCDCLHNTEGRQCQRCKAGFYRDPQRPPTAPDSCKPCSCHPLGSMPFHLADSSICDPSNGNCICKPGVGGAHCDRCMVGYWGFHEYGCRPCDCAGDCDPFTGDCMFGYDLDVYNSEGNSSEPVRIFRADELFSALHYSEKCECKEQALTNSKLFCTMNYAYVLKVKVLSAHDKGSHAEVEVKVQKVLSQNTKVKIQRGRVTLYPESWTARGCTCPILNPGVEYIVAGHSDRKHGRLLVNMKSFVKPWKASLGRKVLTLLKKDCNW
ncbi:Netrin-4 Beta-netrin Hepar-derived netrin-like protein Precursor [Larimichthys crocea]|uniref:Netrin-4 n=2 Tax=Larimichthys crocea TaxID=215358 RepID=A0A6G0HQF2_LARCR|nr:Netrin-4 Beta-netrin Hepar-derived netrin-like protein Precursor [Larimichthys crocea]